MQQHHFNIAALKLTPAAVAIVSLTITPNGFLQSTVALIPSSCSPSTFDTVMPWIWSSISMAGRNYRRWRGVMRSFELWRTLRFHQRCNASVFDLDLYSGPASSVRIDSAHCESRSASRNSRGGVIGLVLDDMFSWTPGFWSAHHHARVVCENNVSFRE
jgi:hypothetical protein